MPASQRFDELQTTEVGQGHVGHDDRKGARGLGPTTTLSVLDEVKRLLGGVSGLGLVAEAGQEPGDRGRDDQVVVDDQNL